ncbi:hypothetical protein RGCCGE502_01496 [Rhizobium grahamii CCGE 502]|uniref:Uncharacterized protein n=2 Tax=Rhizobium grahamii TaxID=1120045 RepID=S3HPR2_9HYPH|nr:hypothetical protein RGCCGE502_01496 [Rhizobium grahamii CCGE 502]
MIGQTTKGVSMSDRFASHAPSLTGPASAGFAIVPNDNLDLPEITRAVYVGIGGDLAVTLASGQVLTFASVSDGSLLPLRVSRVHATGTTAEGVLGLA